MELTEIEIERTYFKAFTFGEIIANIKLVEGVQLPDGPDEHFAKSLFLRTYAECYPQISTMAKELNDIEERIDRFFGTDEFCIVNPDRPPEADREYNVYRCVADMKHSESFLHTKLTWLEAVDQRSDLKKYFDGSSGETFFAVVVASSFMVNYISKPKTK
jgi:hypothetical protein